MIKLGEELQFSKNLQVLELQNCRCDQDGCQSLASGLQHCHSLCKLEIMNTKLGSEGAKLLAQSLKSLPLNTISIVHCEIGHEGILALANEGCLSHTTQLAVMHDKAKSETFPILLQKLSKDISELDLIDICIDSIDISSLLPHLSNWSLLRSLNLTYNPMGPQGAAALVDCFAKCVHLSGLSLGGCSITSDGIPALALGFNNWRKLIRLDLTDNQLCSRAMSSLSEQMCCLPFLGYLFLSHNNIDYRGAIVLAEGLKKCPCLCVFNISHNNIGSIGAAAIACSLRCQTIEFVNFFDNSIDLENELLLINLVNLAKRGQLRCFDLSKNIVGCDNTIRLIICLTFYIQKLYISAVRTTPDEISEIVSFLNNVSHFPKIFI